MAGTVRQHLLNLVGVSQRLRLLRMPANTSGRDKAANQARQKRLVIGLGEMSYWLLCSTYYFEQKQDPKVRHRLSWATRQDRSL